MIRILTLLPLLSALLAPAAEAQTTRSSSGNGADAQAEVFRQALEEIADRHRNELSDSALWSRALDGLVESLGDPYASVFTPDEVSAFDEENTGNYSGIGVQITQLNGRVTITKVFNRTPAHDAGLMEGDVIVEVEASDAREWTIDTVRDSIRGPADSDVRVVIDREGFDEPIPFEITRAEVHVPAVQADLLDDGIGYITIDRIARNSAQEVDSVLRDTLSDARGIILDLRRNPGGYLEESLLMSDVFLERGKRLASLRSREPGTMGSTAEESWTARYPARVPDRPIVVLVDRYTASAAEIVTGALQDHDRALVIGERTFGKGVVQSVIPLPHDHRLRITTGSWYTPLGRALDRPRDREGRPLAEDLDTFPKIATESGREMYAAGGIFPDVELAPDTFLVGERRLLEAAAEHEIPLGTRIQEAAFSEAQRLRGEDGRPALSDGAFDDLVQSLVEEGLPQEVLEHPEARDYLAWRTRVTIAERMDQLGATVLFRMERDPALAEALRLLRTSETQAQLFRAAEASRDRRAGQDTRGARTDGGGAR